MFFTRSKNNSSIHLGSIHTAGSRSLFITVSTCVGCDSCRATADCCCPSTASCAWLPSASPCLWPSACSRRCLRYSKVSVQLFPLLIQGQMVKGSSWEEIQITYTPLHMHRPGPRACIHLLLQMSLPTSN